VVSSWAQTYATAEPDRANRPGALGEALRAGFDRSSHGHPVPAVLAFLEFLLAYTPCVATLAAQRREIGLRWTLVGLATQLAVAWTLAVLVFQVGRALA
jgi:ferrous iron transport protein B